MKKLRLFFRCSLLVFMLAGGVFYTNAHKTSPPSPRHYNCRMPRRDKCNGEYRNEQTCANPLFKDLGLSPKQYDKAEKEWARYAETENRLHEQHSRANIKNDSKLHRDMKKNRDSFFKNIRKIFNPGQYKMFEMRFNNLFLNNSCGADRGREGKCFNENFEHGDFGPIKRGPQPQMMTRPGK